MIVNLVRLSLKIVREPKLIAKFSREDIQTPRSIVAFAGLLLTIPLSVFMMKESLGVLVLAIPLALAGAIAAYLEWYYAYFLFVFFTRILGCRLDHGRLKKMIGLCFAPFIVVNILALAIAPAMIYFNSLAPYFYLNIIGIAANYFLLYYALRSMAKDRAFIAVVLYLLLTFVFTSAILSLLGIR